MSVGEVNFSRCIDSLEAGNWKDGMRRYHWRYHPSRTHLSRVSFPKLPLPFIKRGSLELFKEKKVLVLNEQGLGDDLMFFRGLYPLLTVAGAIAWQTYPELLELFKLNAPREVQFFSERSLDLKYVQQFDCYTTTGSLFSLLGAESPAPLRYSLRTSDSVDEVEVEADTVGMCWVSNYKSPNAQRRTFDPNLLISILDDAQVYSLVHEEGIDRPSWVLEHPPFTDLLVTAKFISRLSMVITVDTSIVHLAGALGKETLLVITDHHDWRWRYLQADGRSALYPSVCLIQLQDLVSLSKNNLLIEDLDVSSIFEEV